MLSIVIGPKWSFYSCIWILMLLGHVILQVMYLGRALRTKETLPDFRECRVDYPRSTSIPRVDG